MRKQTLKTKYSVQTVFLTFVFTVLAVPVSASEITPDNVIRYVNMARESQGINSLAVSAKLTKIAQDKLADMVANKYFAHTSPAGVNPWYWFQKEGYDYHFAGENLAINFKTAEDEQMAWMASPTHRKNILEDRFQEIGVAVGTQELDGQTSIIAVQEFGATFAGTADEGKNFSPLQHSDMMRKDGEIVPQVLSAKSTTPEQTVATRGQDGGQYGILNRFSKNKAEIMEQAFWAVMFFLIFSIVLTSTAFLALAMDKMWAILELEKTKNTENVAK
ncbi:MAG: CAP domain-containing protein [Parcubacteria group bacterium]